MEALAAAETKMREAQVPEPAIAVFRDAFAKVRAGDAGVLPTSGLEPVAEPSRLDELPEAPPDALAQTVVVKLNGGLGTSMGLTRAKSLIEARDGRSFLDLIVAQVQALRSALDVRLPLLLLDSFRTQADTRRAVGGAPGVESVSQHREPRLRADDLQPVEWPADRALEWCPPGHGDVYLALQTSGALDRLLEAGYRHAFLSNADNLGAAVEPRIAAWLAEHDVPFAMEVVRGTEADRKGGHLAVRRDDGRLVLRETAQVPPDDEASFRDVDRWRYYNSNNLWVDLRALRDRLARGPLLGLPLIVNHKRVDPADQASPEVLQLETAMGAAVGVFDGAALLHVPRTRFAPVKTTNDLLAVRSDVYRVTEDARVVPTGGGDPPFIDLDPDHFGTLGGFEARFADGPPSLSACERLVVRGDVTFGAGVVVRGAVTVTADGGPWRIPDGMELDGDA